MKARARGLIVGGLVALSATVFTLALLEVAVRLWFDEGAALVLRDPVVGQLYRASTEEDVFSPSANRMIHRRFNRLGYRGPDREEAKPAGVRRVAVLGDSFIASTALDDADTLPAVLERRLNQRSGGERWEVMSFGVDAYSPAQSLIVWRTYARRFAPDAVVFAFFNGNDVSDGDRRLTNYPRPYFSIGENGDLVLLPPPTFSASAGRWLGEHSRLYVWQKRKVQQWISRWRGVQEHPPLLRYLDPRPGADVEGSWQIAERVISTLADEVRATGASFFLVSIPDILQVRDADWNRALQGAEAGVVARLQRDYPETRLGALAEARGVTFVPLRPSFLREDAHAGVYLPDGHWNEVGTRIAADHLAELLEPEPAPAG